MPSPDNTDGEVLNATLLIYNADQMTDRGRRVLALWLRRQARFLTEKGADYPPNFRIRHTSIDEAGEKPTKSTRQRKLAVSDYAAGQRLGGLPEDE
jgi:hypothetical protein